MRIQPSKVDFERHKSGLWSALAGFTMVEVVVALAILGTTIVAIFGAMRNCSRAAHHARMLTKSVLLAETLLAEAKTSDVAVFETKEGQQDPYTWTVQVAPTPIENLAAVRVEVKWQEQEREQQYELLSLICINLSVEGT
ncbi:MAG: type IV pilus modification PilV family protein [Planctomycetota bacterium]